MTDGKPELATEWTYRGYRETVEVHADAILDELEAAGDEPRDVWAVVAESVGNSHTVTYTGWSIMAVLLSDTDPDVPDYGEPWTTYADLEDPTMPEVMGAMAYVCLLSDVIDHLRRCPDCGGVGESWHDRESGRPERVECSTCSGTGRRDLDELANAAAS